jgi:hypothetical protein
VRAIIQKNKPQKYPSPLILLIKLLSGVKFYSGLLSGNFGLLSGNSGLLSGNLGLLSGNFGELSGNFGELSGNSGLLSGNSGELSAAPLPPFFIYTATGRKTAGNSTRKEKTKIININKWIV